MTGEDRAQAVSALLTETEQAHGAYETIVLGGVYDKAWPDWYAAYAVEHGIGDLIGHPVTGDQLGAFLASTFDAFKAAGSNATEAWVDWTARRIVAEL